MPMSHGDLSSAASRHFLENSSALYPAWLVDCSLRETVGDCSGCPLSLLLSTAEQCLLALNPSQKLDDVVTLWTNEDCDCGPECRPSCCMTNIFLFIMLRNAR